MVLIQLTRFFVVLLSICILEKDLPPFLYLCKSKTSKRIYLFPWLSEGKNRKGEKHMMIPFTNTWANHSNILISHWLRVKGCIKTNFPKIELNISFNLVQLLVTIPAVQPHLRSLHSELPCTVFWVFQPSVPSEWILCIKSLILK